MPPPDRFRAALAVYRCTEAHTHTNAGPQDLGNVLLQSVTEVSLYALRHTHTQTQGLKTWETYFILLSNQLSTEPYKPGSSHSWFRNPGPVCVRACVRASVRACLRACIACASMRACARAPWMHMRTRAPCKAHTDGCKHVCMYAPHACMHAYARSMQDVCICGIYPYARHLCAVHACAHARCMRGEGVCNL